MQHLALAQEIQAVPQQTEEQWAPNEPANNQVILDMQVNWDEPAT
jgi:hypothetical protein